MHALFAIVVHAAIGSAAALGLAPYSVDAAATSGSLWVLGMSSALVSTGGLVATSKYLSRRIRPVSGIKVGILCGVLCAVIMALVIDGIDFSLILYLAILAPALLAVLLATLLDKPKSGWQT